MSRTACTLRNVTTFWQGTVSGLILIGAVGIGVLRQRGWRLKPLAPDAVAAPALVGALTAEARCGRDAGSGRRQPEPRSLGRSHAAAIIGTMVGRELAGPANRSRGRPGRICLYLWLTEPVFMTWANWQNIFRTQSAVGIIAIGMTFVVLTAGIDLSVASIAAAFGHHLGSLDRRRVGLAGRRCWPLWYGGRDGPGQRSDDQFPQDPLLRRHSGHALDLREHRLAPFQDRGDAVAPRASRRSTPSANSPTEPSGNCQRSS